MLNETSDTCDHDEVGFYFVANLGLQVSDNCDTDEVDDDGEDCGDDHEGDADGEDFVNRLEWEQGRDDRTCTRACQQGRN